MERFVKKYDKECMKMMMMKHEETFRQQVHELHRLYRLQKLLMMDMENKQRFANDRRNAADSALKGTGHRGGERRRRRRRRVLNLELPADEYIEKAEEEVVVEVEDGSDIELKLSIGSHWSKGEDASLTSDSGASFSSSSSASGGGLRLQQAEDVRISYEHAEKNQFELDAIREEEGLKQLPRHGTWQCLSLKMV